MNVTIIDLPARALVGLKVRTSMQSAPVDCPAVWQKFVPRMGELAMTGEHSYGVSRGITPDTFDYWAAVEATPGSPVPADFESIELPAGLYARVTATDLNNLAGVYQWLYGQWGATQNEYAVNMAAPCFEAYRADWRETDSLDIFVPVVKK